MHIRISPKFIMGFLTLFMLHGDLTTSVTVSATSSTRFIKQQQSASLSANREIARTVDDRPLSPRLAALQDRLKSGDRAALLRSGKKSRNAARR